MSVLKVEIADTMSLQRQGLMFRESLDSDSGMIFKFSNPQVLKFWGVNTYLPLDIAFVSSDNIILSIEQIKPMSKTGVSSNINCQFAIEANIDYFAQNDINVGDKIKCEQDDLGFPVVVFKKTKGNPEKILNIQ